MIIALPNPDHSFTATLFWPFDGPCGFADPRTVEQHFAEVYPDLVPCSVTCKESSNDTRSAAW